MDLPFNDLFKKMYRKLLPMILSKGVINRVNATSGTVDIYLVSSPQTIIKNVPLNITINPAKVLPGDRCKVDFFDETNPTDMVVAYIYGRPYQP